MSEFMLEYELLDEQAKQEVADFVDFLLEKKGRRKPLDSVSYQQNLLAVSIWSDEDLEPIEDARERFNEWQPAAW